MYTKKIISILFLLSFFLMSISSVSAETLFGKLYQVIGNITASESNQVEKSSLQNALKIKKQQGAKPEEGGEVVSNDKRKMYVCDKPSNPKKCKKLKIPYDAIKKTGGTGEIQIVGPHKDLSDGDPGDLYVHHNFSPVSKELTGQYLVNFAKPIKKNGSMGWKTIGKPVEVEKNAVTNNGDVIFVE